MIDFEQWYEQEIGSENKPEYEAAKWAWDFQQKKLDCCREENKALLRRLDIPDGYKLVPVEPTYDMQSAAWEAGAILNADVYKAMIGAAP